MSQPSRPRARGVAKRRRAVRPEPPYPLEQRSLLAPFVSIFPTQATFTAAATPTNAFLGTVTLSQNTSAAGSITTAAPITSVTMLTPDSSFGGDNVRLKAGPGGVFGNGLYAISRGGGGNSNAVNRPGVIYRVDPATGQARVFFDLNTVLNQLDPNALATDGKNPAANSMGDSTGYVNWYDITFDPEGYITGTPMMLVSSSDRADPAKNAVYMISPSGQFLGIFVMMNNYTVATQFNMNPTAVMIPPPQFQAQLRGLFTGSGIATTNGTFAALFFNSNVYSPGQVISNATSSTLLKGVSETGMALGTIAGFTSTSVDYLSPVYSVFTDFGTPSAPGIPPAPGFSGVQGSNGELLIGLGVAATTTSLTLDQSPALSTDLRRLQDISFDQYGYFSQSVALSTTTTTNTTTGATSTAFTVTLPPISAGSLFVSDLATGLFVTVTTVQTGNPGDPGFIPAGLTVVVPVQGSGPVGVKLVDPNQPYDPVSNPVVADISGESNAGGRIVRITPDGIMTNYAEGFNVSGAIDSSSFVESELSITFSADGTTFWASDGDGVWQFKTTASLAGSTSGTLIGLNDLRTLSVPYDGRSAAVAVVDTGVDANSAPFRGRVTRGTNIYTGGLGNRDLAASTGGGSTTGGGGGGTGGGGGGTGGQGGTATGQVLSNTVDGHGTPVAGVIAQFVPQVTIEPIAIFAPNIASVTLTSSSTTGGTGGQGGQGGATANLSQTSNALTTSQAVYQAIRYVANHPFVGDPVRPGQQARVIASTYAFGTPQTFPSEAAAYKNYPQIVIALKNQMHRLRRLGIAPIAASGQFGAPLGAGSASTGGTTGGTGGTGGGTTGTGGGIPLAGFNNADNTSLGDVNGMSLPAVLNEVISVTGTYPFPFTTSVSTTPDDQPIGVIPNPLGPVLVFGNALTIGGTATSGTGGTGGTGGGTGGTGGTGGQGGTTAGVAANVAQYTAADFIQYNDRITAAANRSAATDFGAPAIDVPTFRRTFSLVTTTGTTTNTSAAGDPNNHMTFSQVGTSMSSAIVTGAYSMVASALNYWSTINQSNGVTSDAYLTTPVGVNTLNFGPHAIKDLSAYNKPDGINGILAYTAVPAADLNDAGSLSTPPLVATTDRQHHFTGTTSPPSYARVSIGNAIASIEGTIAINYLLSHNIFPIIDGNSDGIITAQEIQNFTDTAATKGLAEAGAMARLLGGTSTYAQPEFDINNIVFNENPDQPAALQRRFNYFDYLANGQLKGGVAISSFRMLANTLLPQPTSYVIVDRQRASANGFLVSPTAARNFVNLQHLLPRAMWVPPSALYKYRNISPAKFMVNTNQVPGTFLPFYTLFDSTKPVKVVTGEPVIKRAAIDGQVLSVAMYPLMAAPSPAPAAPSTTPATTTPAASVESTTTPATTTTPSSDGGTSTPAEASTPTGATSANSADAILAALLHLTSVAQQQQQNGATSSTTSSPGAMTPAGTLTPADTTADTGSGTDASASSTSSPASSTTTTTTTATTTTAAPATRSVSPAAAAAMAYQQKLRAAKLAEFNANQAKKKNDNFWSKLWDSL